MFAQRNGWLAAMVGDELVMMSAESGVYLGLNEVGARIWEIIATPMDLAGICEAVAVEFETTPQACRGDVEGFLEELERRDAVARAD